MDKKSSLFKLMWDINEVPIGELEVFVCTFLDFFLMLMPLGHKEFWKLDAWMGGFRDICYYIGIDYYSPCIIGFCTSCDLEI